MNRQFLGYAALAIVVAMLPFVGVYPIFAMKVMCYALFACAFNLLLGFTGLLSFGHAAFLGSAAYAAGHALKVWGLPTELGLLFGVGVAALLGLAMGALAIRRSGIYFAMITLALAQMVFFFFLQAKFTGGEDGLQSVPRGTLLGMLDLSGPEPVLRGDGHLHHRLLHHLAHGALALRPGAAGAARERAACDLAGL